MSLGAPEFRRRRTPFVGGMVRWSDDARLQLLDESEGGLFTFLILRTTQKEELPLGLTGFAARRDSNGLTDTECPKEFHLRGHRRSKVDSPNATAEVRERCHGQQRRCDFNTRSGNENRALG